MGIKFYGACYPAALGAAPGLHIGTSAFTAVGWEDSFYPAGMKPADYLTYYATKFDTVEVDSSFYRTPSTSTAPGVSESIDFFLERLQLSSEYLH